MQHAVRRLALLCTFLPFAAIPGCGATSSSAADAGDGGVAADASATDAGGGGSVADGAVVDGAPIAPAADGGTLDAAGGTGGGPTSRPWTMGTVTSKSLLSFGKVFAHHKTATYLAFGYNDSGGNSQGGLLVTKDEGVTWTELTLPAVDPTFGANAKHNLSYVASDGARLYVISGMVVGVLASDDDGATWMTLPSPPRTSRPAMLAALGGKLYAGSGEGAFVSTDKGASWTIVVPSESANRPLHSIVEAGGGIWFASSNRVLFAPGGDAAQLVEAKQGLAFPGGVESLVAVGSTLFATGPGLYKATAAGAATAWTSISVNNAVSALLLARGALFGIQSNKPVLITSAGAAVTIAPFDMGLPAGPFEGLGASMDSLFASTPGAVWHTSIK